MPKTIELLLPVLTWMITPAGAGAVASIIFTKLRKAIPEVKFEIGFGLIVQELLYNRRYARLSVFSLSLVLGVACAMLVAWLTQQNLALSLDTALAGFVSVVASQAWHLRSMDE